MAEIDEGDPCAPVALWTKYAHAPSEATDCRATVAGASCAQENDVGVYFALGGLDSAGGWDRSSIYAAFRSRLITGEGQDIKRQNVERSAIETRRFSGIVYRLVRFVRDKYRRS